MSDATVREVRSIKSHAFLLAVMARWKWPVIVGMVLAFAIPVFLGGNGDRDKDRAYEVGQQKAQAELAQASPVSPASPSPAVPIPIIQPQVSQADIDRQITAMAVWDQGALADWISWCSENNSGINQEYGSRLNCIAIEVIQQRQPIKP